MRNLSEQFGVPDIQIAGFSIWIHKRQFPDSDEFWDVNWVEVTASCEASGAQVETGGPILHLTEIAKLLRECQQMHVSLSGKASLGCMEPEMDLKLDMQTGGRLTMEVKITPNHLEQKHWFQFEVDQTYLPDLIRNCQNVLEKFPIKHDQNR